MSRRPKVLSLGQLVRTIRKTFTRKPGETDTQRECAEKIGISRSMLALIEADKRVPQDDSLQRLAHTYGRDREERDYLLRELRKAALRAKEQEMTSAFEGNTMSEGSRGQFLPVDLQILIKDRAGALGVPDVVLAEAAGLAMDDYWRVMGGAQSISQSGIINIARRLGEDPEAWLLFCGYIPATLQEKLAEKLRPGLFKRKRREVSSSTEEAKNMLLSEIPPGKKRAPRKQVPEKNDKGGEKKA